MCHYRQAILRGERIPGWSIHQFSEIRIPIRFHNIAADVFPVREGLVIRAGDGEPVAEAMCWGFRRRRVQRRITSPMCATSRAGSGSRD